MYAFNPAGRIIWSVGLSGTVVGDIAVDRDGMLYYATSAGMVAARNHLGKLIWKRRLDSAPASSVKYDGADRLWILLADRTVLSLNRDGEIMAGIDLNSSREGSAVPRKGAGADTGALDLVCDPSGIYVSDSGRIMVWDAGGNYRWSGNVGGRVTAAVLTSELLFIGTSSGEVCAFDKSDGFIRWCEKIPSSIEFLNFPVGADRPLIGAGKFSTHLIDPYRGDILLNILTPAASGHPLMDRSDILYIGGDDWVVYSYDLPRLDLAAFKSSNESRPDAGRSYDTGMRKMSARELYTAEIMKTADRTEYLRLLDDMEEVLRSAEPGIQYHSSLRSVEALCGTGVLNPITRSGYVINDFPEVRTRAASLLAQYGTLPSRALLLQLLRYDWDKV
ncbi:MAG: PQQ-binding-like beta-propeller repeat protein, partial [Sediminispirochaetaceae bacterium]